MVKPKMKSAPAVRPMINIGALMDIPNGWYVKGIHGENVLLGGLPTVDATTGKGNNYKSTLLHFKALSAWSRVSWKPEHDSSLSTYDCESNMHEDRLTSFAHRFAAFKGRNLFLEGAWIVTDKTVCYANKWFDQLKDFFKEKIAEKNSHFVTPFLDRDGKSLFKMQAPSYSEIDSMSQVETDDTAKITATTELGESDANHVYLRQGLAKKRLLDEYITEGPAASHYLLMTAHYGKLKSIGGGGGYNAPPPKVMNSMRPGEVLKGVPDNFYYLTHLMWLADGSAKLMTKDKTPEYPKEGHEDHEGGVDLFETPYTCLRAKAGPSDYTLRIVISQTEGVLPSLTEFHALKDNERWGIEGTLQHYALTLYPLVKLQRTTVRTKIDTDPKLRRALNITSELMQMHQFYRSMSAILPTAKELYEQVAANGYDWDMILDNTRGWWALENDQHPIPFLSTMDLVEMGRGNYHPYWLEADKKTRKPGFHGL